MKKEETENGFPKAIIDWSKWLIGINFSAATGCIIAFTEIDQSKMEPLVGKFFFFAIVAFATCVFVSVVIYTLSVLRRSNGLKLIYTLCLTQLLFFLVGLIFVCLWIGKKAFKESQPSTPASQDCRQLGQPEHFRSENNCLHLYNSTINSDNHAKQ